MKIYYWNFNNDFLAPAFDVEMGVMVDCGVCNSCGKSNDSDT